jgi:hypothetical protein
MKIEECDGDKSEDDIFAPDATERQLTRRLLRDFRFKRFVEGL